MCTAVKAQIETMQELVRTQTDILGADAMGDALTSSVTSLCKQICNLDTFELHDSVDLAHVVKDSDLLHGIKASIVSAMNQRLSLGRSAHAPAPKPAHGHARKQTMHEPHFFFTQGDITFFQDKAKVTSQLGSRAMHRLGLAGLVSPSEVCFGNIASAIAAARDPDMHEGQLHDLVLALKNATQATKQSPPYQVAPASPEVMEVQHPELYAATFAEEGPAGFQSSAYRSIRSRCFVRDSARRLQNQGHTAKRSAPSNHASGELAAVCSALTDVAEKLVRGFAQRFIDDGTDRNVVIYGEQRSSSAGLQARQSGETLRAPSPLALRDVAFPIAGNNASLGFQPSPPGTPTPTLLTASSTEIFPDNGPRPHDIVSEVEAAGSAGKRSIQKKPAAVQHVLKKPVACGLGSAICGAKTSVLKKPAAAKSGSTMAGKQVKTRKTSFSLGCSRCRGSTYGCLSCRNPAFTGARFNL